LISLYGLRVCPILNYAGFYLGCSYATIYIFFVATTNFGLVSLSLKQKFTPYLYFSMKHPNLLFAGFYFLSSLLTLGILAIIFSIYGIPLRSRAPEVLILASLLLAVTQSYGVSWALSENYLFAAQPENSFRARWSTHLIRSLSPLFIMIVVLTHFLYRQSMDLNQGHAPPQTSVDSIISNSVLLILFLFGWLTLTYSFHFLCEKQQLKSVQRHLSELSKFNLTYQSKTEGTWGLWSVLLEQLNSFSQTLGERNRLLNTFSRFVTKEVAQFATQNEIKTVSGINCNITVLMSDIRNFTAISEKLPPDVVVSMLNRYFTAMLDEINKHSIIVDKFIGDGILAYVEPNSNEPAENNQAVHSAIDMIERMKQLNINRAIHPELQIGIGIYRGPVVMGFIGSESKLQHTIIGDTVNRAARLEGLCKDLSTPIVISKSVWITLAAHLQDCFQSEGTRTIKGISEPVEVFGLKISKNPSRLNAD
jgi:class 3 adenylate cyclase